MTEPLDLEPIKALEDLVRGTTYFWPDIAALIAEVERLRAVVDSIRRITLAEVTPVDRYGHLGP